MCNMYLFYVMQRGDEIKTFSSEIVCNLQRNCGITFMFHHIGVDGESL